MYKILRSFTKPEDNNPLPDINKEKLPDEFVDYFPNKIEKIMGIIERNDKYSPPIRPCTKLLNFEPLTEEQILNLINLDASYYMCSGSMQYQISDEIQGHTYRDNNKNNQCLPNYRAISGMNGKQQ